MPRSVVQGIAAAALLLGVASPTSAQTTWTNTGTGDWFTGANWNNGVPTGATNTSISFGGTSRITSGSGSAGMLLVGDTAGQGTLQIAGGTLTTSSHLLLGYGNKGTLSVSGSTSTLVVGDHLDVGGDSSGELTISGGSVTSAYGIIAGQGKATISGGRWDVYQNVAVAGGIGAPGELTISGGTVASDGGYISNGGQATVSGGRWEVANTVSIGDADAAGGQLTISGGTVTSNRAIIGLYGTGTATVTSGRWEVTSDIAVGQDAAGTLNVSGGVVRSSATVHIGSDTHFGSVTLSNSGVIEAQKIVRGSNSGSIIGQGGTIRALADESDFLSGFGASDVVIASGTYLHIDTNGHTLGIATAISGSGSLVKAGSGTLRLTGVTTYKGVTNIDGGTLLVDGDNSASNAINVNGTLGGTGLAANILVQNGGIVSPGDNAPGRLSIHQVGIMNPGSTLLMEFSGTGAGLFDQLALPSFAVSGNSTLNLQILDGYTPVNGDSFLILPGGGIAAGGFDHFVSNLDSAHRWDTSLLASQGIVSIAPAIALPEPTAAVLVVMGLSGVLLRSRRR